MDTEMGHQVPSLRENSVAVIVLADVQTFVHTFAFFRVIDYFIHVAFEDIIVNRVSFVVCSRLHFEI
jgi:hypothetical protein